jgi:hypothetical protein
VSTLDDIRDDLKTALAGVSGLSTYARAPGQLNPPAAVVAPEGIEYDTDFEHGATLTLPVRFYVQLGEWASAQKVMDALISPTDGTALLAINDDTTIEARVLSMGEYGVTDYAGVDYLGATLTVEVLL